MAESKAEGQCAYRWPGDVCGAALAQHIQAGGRLFSHRFVAPEPTGGDEAHGYSCEKCGYVGPAQQHPGCTYLALPWGEPQQGDDLRERIEDIVAGVHNSIIDAHDDLPSQESTTAWIEALVRDEVAKAEPCAACQQVHPFHTGPPPPEEMARVIQ